MNIIRKKEKPFKNNTNPFSYHLNSTAVIPSHILQTRIDSQQIHRLKYKISQNKRKTSQQRKETYGTFHKYRKISAHDWPTIASSSTRLVVAISFTFSHAKK